MVGEGWVGESGVVAEGDGRRAEGEGPIEQPIAIKTSKMTVDKFNLLISFHPSLGTLVKSQIFLRMTQSVIFDF